MTNTKTKNPELEKKATRVAVELQAYTSKNLENLSQSEREKLFLLALECDALEKLGVKIPISSDILKKTREIIQEKVSSNSLVSDVNYFEATAANERTSLENEEKQITKPEEIKKLIENPDKFKKALEEKRLSPETAMQYLEGKFDDLEKAYKTLSPQVKKEIRKAQRATAILYAHIYRLPENERQQALDELTPRQRKNIQYLRQTDTDGLLLKRIPQTSIEDVKNAKTDLAQFDATCEEVVALHNGSQQTLCCAYVLRDETGGKKSLYDCTGRGETHCSRTKTLCIDATGPWSCSEIGKSCGYNLDKLNKEENSSKKKAKPVAPPRSPQKTQPDNTQPIALNEIATQVQVSENTQKTQTDNKQLIALGDVGTLVQDEQLSENTPKGTPLNIKNTRTT